MASLKELQQALAQRLTGDKASGFVNSGDDLLVDFDADELHRSRETLIRKRLSQIASLLPKTHKLLGATYRPLCRKFIETHHFDGYLAPHLDAIHFARWLSRHSEISRWLHELAAWESLAIEYLTRSMLFRIKRFHYSFDAELTPDCEPVRANRMAICIRIGKWSWFRY